MALEHPEYHLSVVPFIDDKNNPNYVLNALNKQFDIFMGCYTNLNCLQKLNHIKISSIPFVLAMNQYHPLASKEILNIEDLFDQTIMIGTSNSPYIHQVREFLMQYPKINLKDTAPFYDLSVFNECSKSNHLLLSLSIWKNLHLGIISKYVNWSLTNDLLLFYHPSAPKEVKDFVQLIENHVLKTPLTLAK